MPTGIITKVVFPSVTVEEEAKLKRLLDSMGQFMGAEIKIESQIVMVVNVPSDRNNVATIVSRMAGHLKTNSSQAKTNKPDLPDGDLKKDE